MRTNRAGWLAQMVVGLWLIAGSGCQFFAPAPTEPVSLLPPVPTPSPVLLSVVPSYRLLLSEKMAEMPSRLVVLYVRVQATNDDVLHFDPAATRLVLPGGSSSRVFDLPRVEVLLKRTQVADWSPGKDTAAAEKSPAPLRAQVQTAVKRQILDNLVAAGDFSQTRPLSGFLVLDAGTAVSSLDYATLEVAASRVSDAAPVHEVYRFASAQTRPAQGGRSAAADAGAESWQELLQERSKAR